MSSEARFKQHNTSCYSTLNAVITFRNIYCHSVCNSPP